jgi:hypothetical protein
MHKELNENKAEQNEMTDKNFMKKNTAINHTLVKNILAKQGTH